MPSRITSGGTVITCRNAPSSTQDPSKHLIADSDTDPILPEANLGMFSSMTTECSECRTSRLLYRARGNYSTNRVTRAGPRW